MNDDTPRRGFLKQAVAGAAAIAVLGAIWDAPDREAAAHALTQLFSTPESS